MSVIFSACNPRTGRTVAGGSLDTGVGMLGIAALWELLDLDEHADPGSDDIGGGIHPEDLIEALNANPVPADHFFADTFAALRALAEAADHEGLTITWG